MRQILHVGSASVFMHQMVLVLEEHFDISNHQFSLISGQKSDEIKTLLPMLEISNPSPFYYAKLLKKMIKVDKVIIHGLCDPRLLVLLYLFPFLLKKTYWVMWGADFYTPSEVKLTLKQKLVAYMRKKVLSRISNLVTYIPQDVEYVRKRYGAKGKYIECLMYTSNVYTQKHPAKKCGDDILVLQVGNSADPENKHFEILDFISSQSLPHFKVYVPLSYGDQQYANKVIEYGKKLFGEKFIPLMEMLPYDQYQNHMENIDIVIFNHEIQQAMGNTINFLGMGKTVYLNPNSPQKKYFDGLGVATLSTDFGSFHKLNVTVLQRNTCVISYLFSEKRLLKQLHNLFVT